MYVTSKPEQIECCNERYYFDALVFCALFMPIISRRVLREVDASGLLIGLRQVCVYIGDEAYIRPKRTQRHQMMKMTWRLTDK